MKEKIQKSEARAKSLKQFENEMREILALQSRGKSEYLAMKLIKEAYQAYPCK